MNLKIIKITEGKNKKNLIYLDVLFLDIGVIIKGIIFKSGEMGVSIIMPKNKREEGASYQPLTFSSKEKYICFVTELKKTLSELVPGLSEKFEMYPMKRFKKTVYTGCFSWE